MLELIWEFKLPVRRMLTITTLITIWGYLGYLSYCFAVLDETTPSVSEMIAFSRGTTITFTLLVFIHAYGVCSYLVIISKYVGVGTRHFKVIAFSSFAYLVALIVVTYLPLDGHEDPHNVFAFLAFFFAILSSLVHRHGVLDVGPSFVEFPVVIIEVLFLVVVVICGALFWFVNSTVAEYVFMFLIIIDKEVKVAVLERFGLLLAEGSYLTYSYYTYSELNTDPDF